jgi:putative flippase GtrA
MNIFFANMINRIEQSKIFIVFCFVGLISAAVDLSILYILSVIINVNLHFSVTLAFISGLLSNYILHTRITFRSSATKSNAIKFLCVVFLNYVLTLSVIEMAVRFGNINIVSAKLISLPIVAISGFLLTKYWVYK